MKIEGDTLYIDEEITDERVDEFIASISQEDIKSVEVNCNNLGASIIQVLLIKKRDKDIVIKDPILNKIFENISYKRV